MCSFALIFFEQKHYLIPYISICSDSMYSLQADAFCTDLFMFALEQLSIIIKISNSNNLSSFGFTLKS